MTMGDMSQLFQQAQKMQRDMKQVTDDLKKRTVVGEAGGGMVKVYANGAQEVLKFEIDKEVIDPEDSGMLEDLLQLATKAALDKARELSQSEMSRVTGGLNLPGLF